MHPKYLLVDIGDVLLVKNTSVSFTEALARELGVSLDMAQEINKAHYTTMDTKFVPEHQFVSELKEKFGYTAPANIYSYFEHAYAERVMPNVQMLHFLKEIRAMGIKTAVLSNTIGIYQRVQEKAGISAEGGFGPIIYSWQVGMLKPSADIFKLAIQKLNVQPEEIIFIDDKAEHIQGAQQQGIQTVLFSDTESVIAQVRNLIAS